MWNGCAQTINPVVKDADSGWMCLRDARWFFPASRKNGLDGVGHAGYGPAGVCRLRIPCGSHGLFNGLWRNVDCPQECAVRSVHSVVRLSRGVPEVLRDEIRSHAVEDGSVKEQRFSGTSLRVAGNFHGADGEVADPLEARGRLPGVERCGDPFQDKTIGGANVREVRM